MAALQRRRDANRRTSATVARVIQITCDTTMSRDRSWWICSSWYWTSLGVGAAMIWTNTRVEMVHVSNLKLSGLQSDSNYLMILDKTRRIIRCRERRQEWPTSNWKNRIESPGSTMHLWAAPRTWHTLLCMRESGREHARRREPGEAELGSATSSIQ